MVYSDQMTQRARIIMRYLDSELRAQFKVYCAKIGKPMSVVVTEWIEAAVKEAPAKKKK